MSGLVIDFFSGGGGASTGIEQALERPIDYAIDHDPIAIAMHKANHPETNHIIQNVWNVPKHSPNGYPIDLAWFSPECTDHSRAKGKIDAWDNTRSQAWIVVRWAESARPRVIILENVQEFLNWGPLSGEKKHIGETFNQWVSDLKDQDYQVEWRILHACDYGAGTIRKRLFVVARCDDHPIVWPDATHGPGCDNPYVTAADIIDWTIPCKSIFNRKKPLVEATMLRIALGIQKYVINTSNPFISGGTVPHLTRYFGKSIGQSVNQPVPTTTAGGGGKTALVTAYLAQHNTGVIGRRADAPLSTITTTGSQQQVVTAFLTKYYGNGGQLQDCRDPLHTIPTKGRFGLVTVNNVSYQIVDICMRMLTPRELFRAQGFPEGHIIDPEIDGKLLTKTQQIRQCGNSVCPPVAKALVKSNLT